MTVKELIEELNELCGDDEIRVGGAGGGEIIGAEKNDEFNAVFIYCEM